MRRFVVQPRHRSISSSVFRRLVPIALVAMNAAILLPAEASAPETGVDHIAAAISDGEVRIQGTARFVDVPIKVGTDVPGDAQPSGRGADIVAATISHPDPSWLDFTFQVADMPADAPALGVTYIWCLQILPLGNATTPAQAVPFGMQAFRRHDGAAGFRLTGPTKCGGGLASNAGGILSADPSTIAGSLGDGRVTFHVPFQRTGGSLKPGAIVRAYVPSSGTTPAQIGSSPGLFGIDWIGSLDTITVTPYTVPSPTVRVGVGTAGTPADQVPLTVSATVLGDSTFTASIPASGVASDSIVVAQACYGDGNCGYATTSLGS
jgi:hypothetical protein